MFSRSTKEDDILLKIKKSHKKRDEWILYNPDNFKLHTHCRSFRVALSIKKNVEKHKLPRSKNLRTIESHKRVTKNKKYIRQLDDLIDRIKQEKNRGVL